MVSLAALCRVCHAAVLLVAVLDVVEIRLFLGVVDGAEFLCPLEHQVLQIVCESCCFGRVVAATGAHGDVGLDARLLVVYRQVDFQTVVEGVDAGVHRVTWHGLVLVVFCLHANRECGEAGDEH